MRLLLCMVLFVSTVEAQNPLVISTYRYSTNDRVKNIEPFAKLFATQCHCQTEVKSYETVAAMLDGMNKGEPTVVFMNTFGYLLFDKRNEIYIPAAALRVEPGKKSTYQSVVVANKSAGLKSFGELKDRASQLSLLLVNPGSTSGNLVPRIGFASAGVSDAESQFRSVGYTKNHALTLRQVAEGIADVGAFGGEEYDKLLQSEPVVAAKVDVLWRSGDIPLGPVVYNRNLSKQQVKCLQNLLLGLHKIDQAVLESVKAGWTEAIPADRYVQIKDADYNTWLKTNGSSEWIMPIIQKFGN